MIWNPEAIDYTSKAHHTKEGTIRYEKTGCYVLTIKEGWEILNKRKKQ